MIVLYHNNSRTKWMPATMCCTVLFEFRCFDLKLWIHKVHMNVTMSNIHAHSCRLFDTSTNTCIARTQTRCSWWKSSINLHLRIQTHIFFSNPWKNWNHGMKCEFWISSTNTKKNNVKKLLSKPSTCVFLFICFEHEIHYGAWS